PRGSRAPHRDPERPRRAEARPRILWRGRRARARLTVPADRPLAAFLDAARARIDNALEHYLPKPPDCPVIMSEAMRYSVFAGGKRFRPILTLAVADSVARDATDLALPAACAIELIHTYSLIHDDLPAMDDDTLRRGRPTLHVVHGDGIARSEE